MKDRNKGRDTFALPHLFQNLVSVYQCFPFISMLFLLSSFLFSLERLFLMRWWFVAALILVGFALARVLWLLLGIRRRRATFAAERRRQQQQEQQHGRNEQPALLSSVSSEKSPMKTLVVLGSGGHTTEMMATIQFLDR